MIEIRIKINNQNNYLISYISQGHARENLKGFFEKINFFKKINNQGKNSLICNGLSAIEYQFLYSIKTICPNIVTTSTVKNGYFAISFNFNQQKKNNQEIYAFKTLCQSLLIGVNMMESHYPDVINVIIDKKNK